MGSLCTGYGGLDLGVLTALGAGRIAWVADPDPHIAQILDARLPGIPNLGDLRHIDWTAVEPVDVLVAGFPCQDISAAGRRVGIEKGTRSGLWTDIVAGLRVLRPALLVVENVAALRWRNGGLHRVLGDLAEAGYDALWRSVRAADIGAAHRRERVFLLAWHRNNTTAAAGADAAHPASARRRPPRTGGPGTTPGAGTPGELARRGQRLRHVPVADSDSLGREELHAPYPGGWAVAAGRLAAAADTDRGGFPVGSDPDSDQTRAPHSRRMCHSHRFGPDAAHTTRHGRHEGLPGPARLEGRPDVALGSHPSAHPAGAPSGWRQRDRRHLIAVPDTDVDIDIEASPASRVDSVSVNWGVYEAAVRRWEAVLGRPVPDPTQPGKHGRPVLAPVFVEHLMGLPEGWVSDLALPRTAQLRALGNGVVPQQSAHAVALLLADLAELLHITANTDADQWPPAGQEVTAA